MKTKAIFYMGKADCSVCEHADEAIVRHLNPDRYAVETVDLSADPKQIDVAERAGVQTVPALVIDGQVFHINFGADLATVRQ